MAIDHRAELARIHRFDQLIRYLRDEMGWPIASDDFEELTFDYTAEELGINAESAAKIQEIKRLRPLSAQQPWGIFFVKFEPKKLPVVALRRILSQVALKKRASANAADRAGWAADDLLFVSNYGQDGERKISFAHFARPSGREDLPTLKVLGWDNQDTPLHLDAIAKELTENLAWPQNENDVDSWRRRWRSAFTLGHREVITTAERLSIRLAELAGAIRDRIRSAIAIESPRGPLTRLMKAFQESLVHDLDAESFADMYAQTISYGLLSSRIADPAKKTADDFAAHMRTSPFLRELMQTFLKVGGRMSKSDSAGIDFDELGVADVVELLDAANMEAVLRDFGDRNRQEDPVTHFFEGFLQAYDRRIRKDRGVFYTPQPVVSYIVRSVHELLQTEFGLADGLADTTTWGEMLKKHPGLKLPPLTSEPNETCTISMDEPFVQILDPATGTATFLVEVIDVIHRHLSAGWRREQLTDVEQRAAWNDYVPRHLLPRLHAFELMMAPYAIAHMKIGLKLAETGYRFETDERARVYLTNALESCVKQLPLIGFDALAHEAAAVNEIKRLKRFTVVIGNPPYSVFSANLSRDSRALIDAYRYVDGVPIKEKSMLRLEMQLQDDYIKFIRNSQSYLDTSSSGIFGMITNHSFVDNPTLRGMRRSLMQSFQKLHILNLHGNSRKKDDAPAGCANENVFDIQQGVGIILGRRNLDSGQINEICYADDYGNRSEKYERLSSTSIATTRWTNVLPGSPFFLFLPQNAPAREEYSKGFHLSQAMPVNSVGIMSGREALTYDFDRGALEERMAQFCNGAHSDSSVREQFGIRDAGGYELGKRRPAALGLDPKTLSRPLEMRPFDHRWVAYSRAVLTADQFATMKHMLDGDNIALIVTRQTKESWGVFVTRRLMAHKAIAAYDPSSLFPLWLRADEGALRGTHEQKRHANYSPVFIREVTQTLGFSNLESAGMTPEDIFYYAYAVFHSPGYRSCYAEFLKIDFPRLPLTKIPKLFCALVRLGCELVALHLLESPRLVQPITEFIGSCNPEVEKASWSKNAVWVNKAQSIGFKGVTEDVWGFHIGGYKVCEKWLKDRKGRTLSSRDIEHYQKIVVVLSETIRLMKEIDRVIEQHGGWPDAF